MFGKTCTKLEYSNTDETKSSSDKLRKPWAHRALSTEWSTLTSSVLANAEHHKILVVWRANAKWWRNTGIMGLRGRFSAIARKYTRARAMIHTALSELKCHVVFNIHLPRWLFGVFVQCTCDEQQLFNTIICRLNFPVSEATFRICVCAQHSWCCCCCLFVWFSVVFLCPLLLFFHFAHRACWLSFSLQPDRAGVEMTWTLLFCIRFWFDGAKIYRSISCMFYDCKKKPQTHTHTNRRKQISERVKETISDK